MGLIRRKRDQEVFTQKQKWDYINLNDFKTRSCWSPVAYFFFFVNCFFAVAVVAADCYTAVNLLVFDRWSSKIDPVVPFRISKWIFAGCILFSFVLIGFSALWSIRAIKGNSVARGYLNVYAQRWWCCGKGGYQRFLVFTELTKSKHGSDYVMLFSYFSFKGWAQVLLADGPRQVLNGITLYAVMKAKIIPGTQKSGLNGLIASIKALEEESFTQAMILSVMLFTCVWWIFHFLQLALAVLLWVMFIWHHVPSGHTLGSYCREKIDKRLKGIVAKNHQRTLEEEREERLKADKAGLGARKPTLPAFGADASSAGPTKSFASNGPTFPTISEKPIVGLQRTNTMDTVTTTVSSRPDTNMPSRPPYAARPPFLKRTPTNGTQGTNASSGFDDMASLLGDRKDPFARTNTPLHRPQPPVGPYSRPYTPNHGPNSSEYSLTNPYETAPLQPHDFLGSSQHLPPVNRNDAVSPFYPNQRASPVNRDDTISPAVNMGPPLHRPLNFDPMRSNSPQQFPPGGAIPRRFPVRSQDAAYPQNLPHQQVANSSSPAPDFSQYREHRHTPPIHHQPDSEVFEMDGGIIPPANEPSAGAVELDAAPVAPLAQEATGNSGFASHPMAFELDTGVSVPQATQRNPSPPRTRRLTPPQPMPTPEPRLGSPADLRSRSPPRQAAGPAYRKPAYQPAGGVVPTSTPPPQRSRQPLESFDSEDHGVGRNVHGNYDIEADVLDSYLHRSPPAQNPLPQPQRPFAQPHQRQGSQGSRPSTPTRGLPVYRESGDYESTYGSSLGEPAYSPPQRSMTADPTSGYGAIGNRGFGGAQPEFGFPQRSMTDSPYHNQRQSPHPQEQARASPPRGNSRTFERPPHGNGGYGGYGRDGGNGGYGGRW
ncbi:hypothetical protein DRE_04331 [Drechslerella stenobrocha 248]|uniref:Vacuolar membrane protein n=1 Tax=Drechslerella stenobrocha 248 TaxID=1043628 RepID=W7I258_9PEZI|nr:hypothetical protein DRE_04331 [Drechslerella stenobrocha 248]